MINFTIFQFELLNNGYKKEGIQKVRNKFLAKTADEAQKSQSLKTQILILIVLCEIFCALCVELVF